MENNTKRYGLVTAITMIVGICIGSGIFFKSDNILEATGGSVFLGVLVFCLAAISIIFGGLCLGEMASRTDRAGGLITYFEEFTDKRMACGFGWFQTFIYYPTITAVVSWVVGIYVGILFGLEGTLGQQILIGTAFMTLCFIYNTLAPKFGGAFQNATTFIKLIPLALIGIFGFLFGDPASGFANVSAGTIAGGTLVAAVGPIAFSYDGWVISTSIAHEIKDSKRNLSRALIFAPIFIMLVYVVYFIGVTTYIGPDQVMALGDAHVQLAAQNLFGDTFAKGIIVFVVISVMGTVNGLVLGYIRLPYSLALRGKVLPFAQSISRENEKLKMPLNSAVAAFAISILWMVAHYFTMKNNFLPNSDISEISISMSYLLYIVLYFQIFKLYRKGEITSPIKGIVVPLIATIGSLFILSTVLQSALFMYYAGFCVLVIVLSMVYYSVKNKA